MMKKLRARLYGRYSSTNQKEESIEQQFEACHAYAEQKGYVVTGTYADKALTGKDAEKRTEFMKMLRDAEKGLFDVLLVWKMDRFARNREDSAIFKGILKRAGVKVVSVMEYIPDGAEGILLESMLDGYAEYFSYNLAENVRRGLNDAARSARFTGGAVPYGFKTGEHGQFVIDEERAPIVREVYERFAKGEPQKKIYDSLNARGLRTLKGKPFTRGSIVSMLQNEKYMGRYTYHISDEEIISIDDGCPAIVSRELWEQAQSKKRPDGISRYARSRINPLTVITRCAYCDAPFHSVSGLRKNGQRYSYYKHRSEDRDAHCNGRRMIQQKWLDAMAVEHIRSIVLDENMVEQIAEKAMELQQENKGDDSALLQSELAEVKAALENIYDAIGAGLFSEGLQERFEKLEERKQALEAELERKKIVEPELVSAADVKAFLLEFANGDFDDTDFRKALLRHFVRRIEITQDHALMYLNYAPTDEAQKLLLFGHHAKAQLHFTTQEQGLLVVFKLPPKLRSQ